jgi:predicted transcriptional regulator
MTQKVTKNDRFNQLLAIDEVGANQELCEFILHEQDLLARKHNGKSTPTKTQLANESTKTAIVGVLNATPEGIRATELANALDISVQKCTALLRQLVLEGRIVRNQDGKVVTFTVE